MTKMTVGQLEQKALRGVELEIPQASHMLDLIADWRVMREALVADDDFFARNYPNARFGPRLVLNNLRLQP